MAWRWFDRKHPESAEWTGFLEPGVKLEGKLESTGTFRIDSTMKGTLVSAGTLILGEHAAVEGEITGNRVIISGHFDGTIQATGRVEIQAKAVVAGDIHTPCLVIDPGAFFEGQCHMVTATEPEAAKRIAIPIRSVASVAS
ncbi:MAG TPA: polymer-forming cytoskeletal protein [Candidatus Acidoferrales bacterium]